MTARASNNGPAPSLQELASADSVALSSMIQPAAASLRTGMKADAGVLWPALTNVLRECLGATSDNESLNARAARPLVFAATFVLHKRLDASQKENATLELTPVLLAQLRRLAQRADDFGPAVAKSIHELADRLSLRQSTSSEEHENSARGDQLVPGPSAARDEQRGPVDEWMHQRSAFDVTARAPRDIAILSALISVRIPVAFAEAIYLDEAVWATEPFAVWVSGLDAPLSPDRHGVAAAALLNARVRELAPRLFLRHPTSLVVQPIASRAEIERMRDEVSRELVSHSLRNVLDVVVNLRAERERKRGPRVVELDKSLETLAGVFNRAGYEEHPGEGAELPFDPSIHVAADDTITNQELVVVTRPGLRHKVSRETLVRPVVDRPLTMTDEGGQA